jgi:hypothetical protein
VVGLARTSQCNWVMQVMVMMVMVIVLVIVQKG